MAQDIVKALTPVAGKFEKHDEHFESDRFVVTSAVGHLLEIQAPEEFDVKRGKWSFAHLPVIPPYFDLKPVDRTKTRLAAVVRQAKRPDVDRARQRVRRGARGRADLPPHRAVRGRQEAAEQASPAAVAAVDDAAGDPRRVRRAAQRRADARAGRRRAVPLRGRLARRHQRHASDDGLQLARRRFLPHDGRARADADARHRRRARGDRSASSSAATYWEIHATFLAEAGEYPGKWFDPKWKKSDEDAELKADRVWSLRDAQAIADAVRGKAATVTEESKPTTQASPAAVRSDVAAARGERPVRLLGEDDALDRAEPLRAPQGADLPAHRFARAAGGLSARSCGRPSRCWRRAAWRTCASTPARPSTATTSSRPSASSTTQRSAITSRSFRRSRRRTACRKPSRSSTTSSRGASWRSSFPRRNTWSRRASRVAESHSFKSEGKVLVEPGWLAIYGKEAQDERLEGRAEPGAGEAR